MQHAPFVISRAINVHSLSQLQIGQYCMPRRIYQLFTCMVDESFTTKSFSSKFTISLSWYHFNRETSPEGILLFSLFFSHNRKRFWVWKFTVCVQQSQGLESILRCHKIIKMELLQVALIMASNKIKKTQKQSTHLAWIPGRIEYKQRTFNFKQRRVVEHYHTCLNIDMTQYVVFHVNFV